MNEESRHHLYQRLQQVLGPEEATTLMEHLPPVGWADVATKRDLDALEDRMNLRFERVDDRFERVDERFDRVQEQFDRVQEQFDRVQEQFDRVQEQFVRVQEQFVGVQEQFDRVDDRFTHVDGRFDGMDRRFDRLEFRLDEQFREFRSLLVSVMSIIAVLFAAMAGAIVAAIKV